MEQLAQAVPGRDRALPDARRTGRRSGGTRPPARGTARARRRIVSAEVGEVGAPARAGSAPSQSDRRRQRGSAAAAAASRRARAAQRQRRGRSARGPYRNMSTTGTSSTTPLLRDSRGETAEQRRPAAQRPRRARRAADRQRQEQRLGVDGREEVGHRAEGDQQHRQSRRARRRARAHRAGGAGPARPRTPPARSATPAIRSEPITTPSAARSAAGTAGRRRSVASLCVVPALAIDRYQTESQRANGATSRLPK